MELGECNSYIRVLGLKSNKEFQLQPACSSQTASKWLILFLDFGVSMKSFIKITYHKYYLNLVTIKGRYFNNKLQSIHAPQNMSITITYQFKHVTKSKGSQKIVLGGFHWSLEMRTLYKLVKHNKHSKEKLTIILKLFNTLLNILNTQRINCQ